ncbi:MAG: hypothetical protein RL264_1580 [Bacteroidota bacterium]|jgi:hypothetical protein
MKKILLVSLSIILLAQYSCKKVKPEIPDPKNPCDFYHEVNANFIIEEFSSPSQGIWIESDTVHHSSTVRFNAIETCFILFFLFGQFKKKVLVYWVVF